MESVFVACACVGWAVLVQTLFEGKTKPFNCGFCLSIWFALIAAFRHDSSPFLDIGLTAVVAGLIAAFTPLFQSAEVPATTPDPSGLPEPMETSGSIERPTSPVNSPAPDYHPQDQSASADPRP